jgi:hypothetical protein
MQIELQEQDLGILIDALSTAIEAMAEAERFVYIEDLTILKLSLQILRNKGANSAAKEQRKGRAKLDPHNPSFPYVSMNPTKRLDLG